MNQATTFRAKQPVSPFSAALALNARVDGGAVRADELQLSRFRVQRASSRLKWTADRGFGGIGRRSVPRKLIEAGSGLVSRQIRRTPDDEVRTAGQQFGTRFNPNRASFVRIGK
jgi:hypothetical protein